MKPMFRENIFSQISRIEFQSIYFDSSFSLVVGLKCSSADA
jgi:hypothetical protein